jgi:hypothetical protein
MRSGYAKERLEKDEKIRVLEMDYKDPVQFDIIKEREWVFILDFSLRPADFEKLKNITPNIVWIDHHETAMLYPYNVPELRGMRDAAYSGCELSWLFFCPKDKTPHAVKHIGDRDTWAWKYGETTAKVCEGIKIFPHSPDQPIWDDLLGRAKGFNAVAEAGQIALKYKAQFCRDYLKLCSYETNFEGYPCLAINLFSLGSETFLEKFNEYPICICYVHNGRKFQVSLYSKLVDLRDIATKYGGGGHKFAAGFVCETLPFKRIDEQKA